MISERQFQDALNQINTAFEKLNATTERLKNEIKELKAVSDDLQPKKGKAA